MDEELHTSTLRHTYQYSNDKIPKDATQWRDEFDEEYHLLQSLLHAKEMQEEGDVSSMDSMLNQFLSHFGISREDWNQRQPLDSDEEDEE